MGDTLDKITVEVAGKIADVLKSLAEAEAALDAFAAKAKKTSDETSKSTRGAGKDVEEFSRLVTSQLKDGETAFQSLNKQVDQTRAKVAQLRQDFARTGNQKSFEDLQQAEKDLKSLEFYIKQMGGDLKSAGRDVDDFTRLMAGELKQGEQAWQAVGRQIDDTRKRVEELRTEFARTGSQSIFGDLKKTQNDLKTLESIIVAMQPKVKKVFADGGLKSGDSFVEEAQKAISQAAPAFGGALGKLWEPLGSIGAPMIAAVGGPLAVGIIAVLLGALVAGIGAIGVAIGYELVKTNDTVLASLKQMKSEVGSVLHDAATPLIGAFSSAFQQIGQFFEEHAAEFEHFFAAIEPAIHAIVSIFLDFIATILPGLTSIARAFSNALNAPLVQRMFHLVAIELNFFFEVISSNRYIAEAFFVGIAALLATILAALIAISFAIVGIVEGMKGLETVGVSAGHRMAGAWQDSTDAIGNFGTILDTIATGGANLSIIALWRAFNPPIHLLAENVGLLGEAFNIYNNYLAVTTDHLFTLNNQIGMDTAIVAKNYIAWYKATGQYQDATKQLQQVRTTADTVAQAMVDKVVNATLTAQHATLSWYESLTSLTDALKQNHDALNIHTKAGQADREAILNALQANLSMYDSMIQVGYSSADATKAYESNIASLEKLMHQAGLTNPQIQKMVGTLADAPKDVNISVAMFGLTDAINGLTDLIAKINGVAITLQKLTPGSYNAVYGGTGDQGATSRAPGGANGTLPPKQQQQPPPPPPAPISRRAQRYGGIVSFAGSGIYDGYGQGITFAESATHREAAFVPENGDRNRSLATLTQVARDWFGMELHPIGSGGPSMGGGREYVPIILQVNRTTVQAIHAELIPVSQRYKARTGTTGLT